MHKILVRWPIGKKKGHLQGTLMILGLSDSMEFYIFGDVPIAISGLYWPNRRNDLQLI
jgi:hypothetical protein